MNVEIGSTGSVLHESYEDSSLSYFLTLVILITVTLTALLLPVASLWLAIRSFKLRAEPVMRVPAFDRQEKILVAIAMAAPMYFSLSAVFF